MIEHYFEGVVAALAAAGGGTAPYQVGVYGAGRVCAHIKETKQFAVYSWLAGSHGWAGHDAYRQPDIRQEVAASVLCKLGSGVDGGYEDNYALGEFGAFSSLQPGVASNTFSLAQASDGSAGSSPFARSVASLGRQQYGLYHQLSEDEPPLGEQIRIYWEEIGFVFPGVRTAWSAVFVSWIMHSCGAGAGQFKASTMHSRFVYWAINNLENDQGLFRAHRLEDYAPRVGDIIHNNRSGQSLNYSFAAAHEAYESHSAVVVEVGTDGAGAYALTVGGNEGNTIGQKRVLLQADGTVKQRASNPYICVVQNLK